MQTTETIIQDIKPHQLRDAVVVPPLEAEGWSPKEVPPMFAESWRDIRRTLSQITKSEDPTQLFEDSGNQPEQISHGCFDRFLTELHCKELPQSLKDFFSGTEVKAYWVSSDRDDRRFGSYLLEGYVKNGTAGVVKHVQITVSDKEIEMWKVSEFDRASNGDVARRELQSGGTRIDAGDPMRPWMDSYVVNNDVVIDECKLHQRTGKKEKFFRLENPLNQQIQYTKPDFYRQGGEYQKVEEVEADEWQSFARTVGNSGGKVGIYAWDEKDYYLGFEKYDPRCAVASTYNTIDDNLREFRVRHGGIDNIDLGNPQLSETKYPLNYITGFMPIDKELFSPQSS